MKIEIDAIMHQNGYEQSLFLYIVHDVQYTWSEIDERQK